MPTLRLVCDIDESDSIPFPLDRVRRMPAPRAWWNDTVDAATEAEAALDEVAAHLDELHGLLDDYPDPLPFIRSEDDGPWAA